MAARPARAIRAGRPGNRHDDPLSHLRCERLCRRGGSAALAQGMQPILAGRNRASLEPLAKALGVEFRPALDDAAPGRERDVPVVLRQAVQVHFEADGRCVPARRVLPRLTGEIGVRALAARC